MNGMTCMRRRMALLACGLLLASHERARAASSAPACAPAFVLAPPRDVGTVALTADATLGRCAVEIVATNDRALQRQLQLMHAITTAACAAPPETVRGPPDSFAATLRLPAACAGKADSAVFEQDPRAWQAPPRQAPRYPPAAAAQELQGRVLVSMVVDPQGRVAAAVVRRSSGHDVLDEAAIADVRGWQFTSDTPPAGLTLMLVPISYLLQ